ncbi:MAG: tetratricopeptide repeat protein [Acidobacteriia bacterium]|nr:tetratricopeptide repeat protein [Terriglobia bacterium]
MTDWNRFREMQTLRESGRPAEALTEFKALRKNASDAVDRSAILQHEALCYYDLGRFDEEVEAASEAVKLLPEENPSRPYAEFSLACAHGHADKSDLAVQELKAFLKKHADFLNDKEEIELRRSAQLRLIENLISLDHGVEPLSIANDLKMEDISPEERAELSYREAEAHRILGRGDHALKLYQEAINGPLVHSLAARAHFHIGEVLYDRGEFSQAVGEFKAAENLADPANPDKTHFAKWVEHTLRAAGNPKTDELPDC